MKLKELKYLGTFLTELKYQIEKRISTINRAYYSLLFLLKSQINPGMVKLANTRL